MSSRGAFFNRAARRSGGDRRVRIPIITENRPQSINDLSIQCFEGRHKDCWGLDTFGGAKCQCKCNQQ